MGNRVDGCSGVSLCVEECVCMSEGGGGHGEKGKSAGKPIIHGAHQ